MKDFFYNIALKIAESRKTKDEEKKASDKVERERQAAEWRMKIEIISTLRRKYLEDLEVDYAKRVKPRFQVGQKVLMNPYSDGDIWEGSVRSILSHTPFNGPVEVIIDSVHIDTTRLSEIIDNYRDLGYFDKIKSESDYEKFINIISHRVSESGSKYQWVMHIYKFHKENEPGKYWCYSLREDKFVAPFSKEGKAVLKLGKMEADVESKKQAAKKAREDYEALQKDFHKKIGITYNIVG